MKKGTFLLILCAILFQFNTQAQTDASTPEPILNFNILQKKLEKSDAAIQDAKKGSNPKTWMTRAKLMEDIYDIDIQFTRLGITRNEMNLYPNYANPLKTETTVHNKKNVEAVTYERAIFYFENGSLIDWKKTQWVTEDPLFKALEAYEKAAELDTDGKLKEKIAANVTALKAKFEIDGVRGYNSENYEMAFKNFEKIIECNEVPVYDNPVIDSSIYYNTALAASNNNDPKTAIKYYKRSADIGYGGANTYLLIKKAYVTLKDSTNILNTLKEGFEKYPNDQNIVIELINYYKDTDQTDAALEYINIAKKKEPENVSLLFAEANLYEQTGRKEKAIEIYKEAIKIDPNFFNGYYNLGVAYYNKAVEIFDAAVSITDDKEYEKEKIKAEDEFKKSLPYMEKAHEIDPNDITTMETLKTLYYRLQKEDLHDAMVKKIEAAKAGQ